ncbi:MAG: tetratricopeptide repeat protein, partial [Mariprofundaceae bacterium]|nr:tetratricopeptide repeat protein [Mariprofundaceae bacterium]
KRRGEELLAQAREPGEAQVEACDALFASALRHVGKAIRLQPEFADAHFNRAMLLKQRGEWKAAVSALRKVVQLNPRCFEAWNEMGHLHLTLGSPSEASAAFLKASDSPEHGHEAYSNHLLSLNYITEDAEALFAAHRQWEARFSSVIDELDRAASSGKHVLNIGYVSPDLHNHSVAFFVAALIEGHDRMAFRVFCYSDSRRSDVMHKRIKAAADVWRDTADMDDAALAQCIREDGIDILVDLAGHTSGNRMRVFAARPAPVQVSYIGYPNTTGLSAMTHRISDAVADPPGNEVYCTEQLVRLPGGFLCYSPPQAMQSIMPAAGIAEKSGMTLGCFNVLAKISDECVRTWAALLHRVPDARLLIKNISMLDQTARSRLLARFKKHGIAARRLELIAWLPSPEAHYALYRRLDLALDTFPYNGTTTTCEALCMGVPVLTLAGRVHAARVGASLLHRVGLDSLVAASATDYVRIAGELLEDDAQCSSMREGLVEKARDKLCDRERLLAELEHAYRSMWRKWCEINDV